MVSPTPFQGGWGGSYTSVGRNVATYILTEMRKMTPQWLHWASTNPRKSEKVLPVKVSFATSGISLKIMGLGVPPYLDFEAPVQARTPFALFWPGPQQVPKIPQKTSHWHANVSQSVHNKVRKKTH